LGHSLFGEVLQGALKLLCLHGIVEAHPTQNLGREIGDAGETDILAFGRRIADPQGAMVGDADNVARQRLLGEFANRRFCRARRPLSRISRAILRRPTVRPLSRSYRVIRGLP
jgi:hypothetical protein